MTEDLNKMHDSKNSGDSKNTKQNKEQDISEVKENIIKDTSKRNTKENKEQDKLNKYIDLLQRSRADFVNYKQRVDKQIESNIFFELKKQIIEFLLFEQALKKALKHETNLESKKNIQLLNEKFDSILSKLNIKKLDVLNKDFDYNTCDCVDKRKVENIQKNNKILEIVQDGYLFKNKLILPAKVIVGVMEE